MTYSSFKGTLVEITNKSNHRAYQGLILEIAEEHLEVIYDIVKEKGYNMYALQGLGLVDHSGVLVTKDDFISDDEWHDLEDNYSISYYYTFGVGEEMYLEETSNYFGKGCFSLEMFFNIEEVKFVY